MQQVIIVIHLMLVLALIGVVLLQRSEGGGLGIGGGGGFMTSRGTANVLTRATAILAGLFFVTSLVLSILAGLNRKPSTILEGSPGAPAQTAPGAPSVPAPNVRHQAAVVAACSTNCSRVRRRPPRRRAGRRCRSQSERFREGPGNRPFGVMGNDMEPRGMGSLRCAR